MMGSNATEPGVPDQIEKALDAYRSLKYRGPMPVPDAIGARRPPWAWPLAGVAVAVSLALAALLWIGAGSETYRSPSIRLVLERPRTLVQASWRLPSGMHRPASLQQPFVFTFRVPKRPRLDTVAQPASGSG